MTKIFTLVSLLYVVPVFTNAQFETGQKVRGGSISFSNARREGAFPNNDYANTSFSVNPSFATFVKPNLLRGIGLSYNYYYQKTNNNSPQIERTYNNSIGLNLYAQRFFPLANKFFFTIQSAVAGSYNFNKQVFTSNNIDNEYKSKGYGVSVSVSPGLTYKLTDRFLIDAYLNNFLLLAYNHSEGYNSFAFSSGLSNTNVGNIGVGFRWLVKKRV